MEETGLAFDGEPRFLAAFDYQTTHDGCAIHHRRYFFHISLQDRPQDNWLHWESHPFGSDVAILLHFYLIDLTHAHDLLGYEMNKALHLLLH